VARQAQDQRICDVLTMKQPAWYYLLVAWAWGALCAIIWINLVGCKQYVPQEVTDNAALMRYAGKTVHCIRRVGYQDIRIHFTDEDTLVLGIYKYRAKINGE
jgi:hypothetical protein